MEPASISHARCNFNEDCYREKTTCIGAGNRIGSCTVSREVEPFCMAGRTSGWCTNQQRYIDRKVGPEGFDLANAACTTDADCNANASCLITPEENGQPADFDNCASVGAPQCIDGVCHAGKY
jgi:hypothetical protein